MKHHIIVRPLITEKLTAIQSKLKKYAFQVDMDATKSDIKQAVEALYPEVKVEAVNTIIVSSKPKGRFTKGGYVSGRSKVWKKAIISLKEGSEIDFFSEV